MIIEWAHHLRYPGIIIQPVCEFTNFFVFFGVVASFWDSEERADACCAMAYVSRERFMCCQALAHKQLLSNTRSDIDVSLREPGLPVGRMMVQHTVGLRQLATQCPQHH